MKINFPYKIRAGLYIFTALGSPVVGYLFTVGTISKEAVALWGAEVLAINLMAAFNTSPTEEEL